MGSVRQMKGIQGHQIMLRQRQARWNRTQFLALSRRKVLLQALQSCGICQASGDQSMRGLDFVLAGACLLIVMAMFSVAQIL